MKCEFHSTDLDAIIFHRYLQVMTTSPALSLRPWRTVAAAKLAFCTRTHSSVSAPISLASLLLTESNRSWYSRRTNLSGLASMRSDSTVQARCTGVGRTPKEPVSCCLSTKVVQGSQILRTVVEVDKARVKGEKLEHRVPERWWCIIDVVPQIDFNVGFFLYSRHSYCVRRCLRLCGGGRRLESIRGRNQLSDSTAVR